MKYNEEPARSMFVNSNINEAFKHFKNLRVVTIVV